MKIWKHQNVKHHYLIKATLVLLEIESQNHRIWQNKIKFFVVLWGLIIDNQHMLNIYNWYITSKSDRLPQNLPWTIPHRITDSVHFTVWYALQAFLLICMYWMVIFNETQCLWVNVVILAECPFDCTCMYVRLKTHQLCVQSSRNH